MRRYSIGWIGILEDGEASGLSRAWELPDHFDTGMDTNSGRSLTEGRDQVIRFCVTAQVGSHKLVRRRFDR